MSRRHLAKLALALAMITSAPVQGRPWDKAEMPGPIRGMIHLNATMVPPYGHEDSTLLDRLRWPAAMEFAGLSCSLYIVAAQSDVGLVTKSVAAVPKGYALSLGYSRLWKGGKMAMGPRYSWNGFGRLWRRIWYEPDTAMFRAHLYSTYPSGSLFEYSLSERSQDPSHIDSIPQFMEYFDRAGRLIGVAREGGKMIGHWWKGESVSAEEWNKALRELYAEQNEEERKQARKKQKP